MEAGKVRYNDERHNEEGRSGGRLQPEQVHPEVWERVCRFAMQKAREGTHVEIFLQSRVLPVWTECSRRRLLFLVVRKGSETADLDFLLSAQSGLFTQSHDVRLN